MNKPPLEVLAWPAGTGDEHNPYARLMYSAFVAPEARIVPFHPLMPRLPPAHVFHLQWPEGIFAGRAGRFPLAARGKALRVLLAARNVRRWGGLVALTMHNLVPHGLHEPWQQALYDAFVRQLLLQTDLRVALSPRALTAFTARHPESADIPAATIPHPHYRDCYVSAGDRKGCRAALGLPVCGVLTGILGTMRPSKAIPAAIHAFRHAARAGEMLLVTGECASDALWHAITEQAMGDDRIVLRRGGLTEAELAAAVRACDVCLINQQTTLNSGTALLALSLDTPVIAPEVGGLPDLADLVGPEWMQTIPLPLAPDRLRTALDRLLSAPRSPTCAALDQLSPTRLSQTLLDTFKAALDHKRQHDENFG